MSKWGALLNDAQQAAQEEDAFGDTLDDEEYYPAGEGEEPAEDQQQEQQGQGQDGPVGHATEPVPRKDSGGGFYLVNGPPPATGTGAPHEPSCVVSVNVPTSERQKDVSGKEVVWYQLHVRTTTHKWFVLKRYSDCNTFHENLRSLDVTIDNFPRKQLFAKQDDSFIVKRREALDTYFRAFLRVVKELHERKAMPALQMKGTAAFDLFMDFCRVSSRSNASALLRPTHHHQQVLLKSNRSSTHSEGPRDVPSGAGREREDTAESTSHPSIPPQPLPGHRHVPAARVILHPKVRFSVMLYLPGVTMSDVYVGPNLKDETSVVVGGRWGVPSQLFEAITSPLSLASPPSDAPPSDERGRSSSVGPGGTRRAQTPGGGRGGGGGGGKEAILMDTLPTDDFEMLFDIPPQFDRDDWKSDFADGVLYIVWDVKVALPSSNTHTHQQTYAGRSHSVGSSGRTRSSSGGSSRGGSVRRARSTSSTGTGHNGSRRRNGEGGDDREIGTGEVESKGAADEPDPVRPSLPAQ